MTRVRCVPIEFIEQQSELRMTHQLASTNDQMKMLSKYTTKYGECATRIGPMGTRVLCLTYDNDTVDDIQLSHQDTCRATSVYNVFIFSMEKCLEMTRCFY